MMEQPSKEEWDEHNAYAAQLKQEQKWREEFEQFNDSQGYVTWEKAAALNAWQAARAIDAQRIAELQARVADLENKAKPTEKFYVCDVDNESGTGDDSFCPILNTSGYPSYEAALEAISEFAQARQEEIGWDKPIENKTLEIRSRSGRGGYLRLRRMIRASSHCPICGYDRPHTHSRKEIAEGTVDTRTSTWWPSAMEEMWERQGGKWPNRDLAAKRKGE